MYPNSGPRPPHSPNSNNVNFIHPQQNYPPNYQSVPQQQQYLSPQNPHLNRGVYTSMIHPQHSSSIGDKPVGGGLLGKLESMGRMVKEDPDPVIRVSEPPTHTLQVPNNNLLSFRSTGQKPKMSSSVIFAKNQDQGYNQFQNSAVQQGTGTSRLEALMNRNKNPVVTPEEVKETPEQQRKREIDSIKSELGKLNKRMENFSFKKPGEGAVENKQYFQLPTRKSAIQQPNSTDSNLNFFKTYSNSSNSSSGGSTAYGSYTPPNNQVNQHLKPQDNSYAPQMQHSFSSNQLGSHAKREEPMGMFKKKNPYQLDPTPADNQPARKFMLSPKSHNNAKTELPPNPPKPIGIPSNQYKAAEIVNVPQPKKGMKRIDSSEKQLAVNEPKKFKRSDFAVGKKLGKGQFGEVMLVIHKQTGFLCGMKVMSKKQIVEEKYVNQVARELSIQFYLSHRNVSPLYGYFEDEENVYLLVEYATGGQLLQLLRKAHRMEESQCSPIIREICEGLDYIHKEQIIHRDIKPQNILFNFDTVKICDFGWAVYSGNGMRRTVAGSPLYYSPEVVTESSYDEKIDIWAIGMMAYECLLGKIPFRIYSELDLNRIVQDEIKFPEYVDVTDEAKDFILRICKKNPEERMQIREMMRHPFITKYLNEKKVSGDIIQQFKKVLTN